MRASRWRVVKKSLVKIMFPLEPCRLVPLINFTVDVQLGTYRASSPWRKLFPRPYISWQSGYRTNSLRKFSRVNRLDTHAQWVSRLFDKFAAKVAIYATFHRRLAIRLSLERLESIPRDKIVTMYAFERKDSVNSESF